jgi:methylmalonyl-CoA/ethylmalonyl-CoA epimerase
MAVPDLDAAVADWTDRLGWALSARSTIGSTFRLDDSYLELVAAGDESPGVTSVSVVVDDVDEAADRLRANGVSLTLSSEGHATVDPGAVNGVPLELRADDDEGGVADQDPADGGGPYRRLNHIVVAVSDDEAAKATWARLFGDWTEQPGHTVEAVHHVPVGIAWFGLTGSGTDAGALTRFLERRGEGIYALALVVDDHPATTAALETRGAQIIRQESSGQTFVHPRTSHGILIDLVPERHPSRVG